MRRTKEILRLRFGSGLGLRQIARSLSISIGTVHDYLQRAEAANIKWPLPEGFDDNRLEAALFRQPTATLLPRKEPPDYAAIAASASCTSGGGENRTWFYASNISLANGCLSIGPEPPFRSTTGAPARSRRPHCS